MRRTRGRQLYRYGLCLVTSLLLCPSSATLSRAQQTGTNSKPIGEIVNSIKTSQFDLALKECAAALKTAPADKRIWTLQGMAYMGKVSPAAALKAYRHALNLDQNYLPALEGAAQVEYQRRDPGAKALILRVLSERPDDPTSHTMLGFLNYGAKDCTGAIEHFRQGGAVLTSQPLALSAYGACLAQDGEYQRAIPIFQQALTVDPSVPNARYNLALAQWKANQAQEALATLQPALENSGDQSGAILLAADIYESMNDTQRAIDLLRRAILANPKNIEAYVAFASLSYDHASMQVGIDIVNAGLTQLPNEARLYLVRGILYIQLGHFDEASEDFGKANQLNPNLSLLGAAEGLAASQRHKDNQALSSFRAAAQAQPDDALTQYFLAEALAQRGAPEGSADYVEVVAAARKAYQLDPSMIAAHDLLATIYLQQAHPQLAMEESRAALKLDPNDQQALYHLILSLRKTGDKDQIPPLLKQMLAARAANQDEQTRNKRFQLQEVPAPSAPH
jgi:tetratricopeptide (TPR) repeat protein